MGETNAIFDLKREFTCYPLINLIQQKYLLCLTRLTKANPSTHVPNELFSSLVYNTEKECIVHII